MYLFIYYFLYYYCFELNSGVMGVRVCVFILLCLVSQSGKTCGTRGPTPVPCGLQTKCLMMRMRTQIAQSSRFWQSRWFHRWDCSSGPSHCCPRIRNQIFLGSNSRPSFSIAAVFFSSKPSIPKVPSWRNTMLVPQFRLSGKRVTLYIQIYRSYVEESRKINCLRWNSCSLAISIRCVWAENHKYF